MKTRRTLAARTFACVVFAATLVALPQPARASTVLDPIFLVNASASHLCLQPTGFNAGDPVATQVCNGTAGQAWNPIQLDNNDHFQFQSVGSGLCLDARGGASNGTPVQIWPCNSISNERWTWLRFDNTFDTVRSNVSGTNSHCLDVPWGSQTPGTNMWIYACNDTAAQTWLDPVVQ
jgi:hypothetical protein